MANASTDLSVPFNLSTYLEQNLGPQRLQLSVVIPITCIYPVLFLLGVGGNLLTCVVIYKNSYMHTTTNFYLFSLAVSDLLMLLLGLPLELYSFWHQYPYVFPEFVCAGRALISEMTTNASILTITAFTIERYIAICHPFFAQAISTLARTKRIICLIWLMALAGAAPFAHFLRITYLHYPNTNPGIPIPESAHCNVPEKQEKQMFWLLISSSSLFFLLPLTVLSVLYVRIAIALGRSARRFDMEQMRTGSSTSDTSRTQSAQSRKSIVRMLFLVCLAFFACWAPFHSQRLLWALYTDYFKNDQEDIFHMINGYLYAWAGCFYYSNSVINVIIYNAMSHRFRHAFSDTIFRSACRRGREHDYTNGHYHYSTAPSAVQMYPPYRRQSLAPSLPPSRRGSHAPQCDNALLELHDLRMAHNNSANGRLAEADRVRQDSLMSTDSGLGIAQLPLPVEFQLVTLRDNNVSRIVRLRQVSESSSGAAVDAIYIQPKYRGSGGGPGDQPSDPPDSHAL